MERDINPSRSPCSVTSSEQADLERVHASPIRFGTPADNAAHLVLAAGSLERARQLIEKYHPSKLHHKRFMKWMRQLWMVKPLSTNLKIENFNEGWRKIPKNFQNAIEAGKVVALSGTTGIGKSTWAALMHPNYLRVNNKYQLNSFDPNKHTGIIFDDLNPDSFGNYEELLCFLDCSCVWVRYTKAIIPANVPRIFTTYLTPDEFIIGNGRQSIDMTTAMLRRVSWMIILGLMYDTSKVSPEVMLYQETTYDDAGNVKTRLGIPIKEKAAQLCLQPPPQE